MFLSLAYLKNLLIGADSFANVARNESGPSFMNKQSFKTWDTGNEIKNVTHWYEN